MVDEELATALKELKGRPWYRRKRIIAITAFALFMVWFTPWIPMLMIGNIKVMRLDAKGQPIQSEVGPNTKQWVGIKSVSRHLINAIIVAEDSKFYEHHGLDFAAIKNAYYLNKRKGKFVRGGSTISQQVVKMAFLSREKTYVRKMREAIGTVLMELILSKDQIMEWYINLTEFGGGIYGVKQAGQFYFKTRPELITSEQAIHLALVIPSPNKWSKGLRSKSLTTFGHKRFQRIANNLLKAGYISAQQRETILARGNFGSPIAGSRAAIAIANMDDDDDCKTSAECDEVDDSPPKLEKSESESANPDLQKKQTPSVSTKLPSNIESVPSNESLPTVSDQNISTPAPASVNKENSQ
ncbi:MAG: transglycosylase domain-containing protein [Proteobacteria bacterium]|nr:transglycosylase domain-containing protein [Pseudomonadota bacterium]